MFNLVTLHVSYQCGEISVHAELMQGLSDNYNPYCFYFYSLLLILLPIPFDVGFYSIPVWLLIKGDSEKTSRFEIQKIYGLKDQNLCIIINL